ncbi:hypothetical protein C5167_049431 [Papaver somniferum]|uniref:FAR1 domain-containing protein n=1 Tax=Papaver somniferum TaxID=3469 RepID=A0A4Y7KKT5_PAPSO|nr:hypothetical protein C5167_049431 [Papaver somniferum]
MQFNSYEEAKEYYTEYGRRNGFTIRVRSTNRTRKGFGEVTAAYMVRPMRKPLHFEMTSQVSKRVHMGIYTDFKFEIHKFDILIRRKTTRKMMSSQNYIVYVLQKPSNL